MTWKKNIYEKYKDTKLMKEFWVWVFKQKNFVFTPETSQSTIDNIQRIHKKSRNIKDIWGYLVVFAETKGYGLTIDVSSNQQLPRVLAIMSDLNDEVNTLINRGELNEIEEMQLWCVDKFFEVAK